IRSTRILLAEGNLLVVPNAELSNTRVVNLTVPRPHQRGEVRVQVARGAVAEASALLVEIARAEPRIVTSEEDGVAAPVVAVAGIEGRAVELALRFTTHSGERGAVEDRLRAAIA